MNAYDLNQTVYYFMYLKNIPYLQSFIILTIRQTEEGFSYSQFIDVSAPFKPENELFETIEDAVNYQIALLEAFIPV